MLNYNYVFFDSEDSRIKKDVSGYRSICTADLKYMKEVNLVTFPLDYAPLPIRLLFLLHHSRKINSIIKLPLKRIWYPFYFKEKHIEEKPKCFILSGSYITPQYLRYLKKRYKDCKIIKIHRDLLHLWKKANPDYNDMVIDELFDVNFTYDLDESIKYNYFHFDEFESRIDDLELTPKSQYDVFFAGKAKDRLSLLIQIYDKLSSAGLNCYFYITGVPLDKQISRKGIEYGIRNMLYKTMLEYSISARCILEVLQKDAVGYTSRFLEAVMYNKKLLTNNANVKKSKFYNPKYIQCFPSVEEINENFINDTSISINYEYNGEFSPTNLIIKIDNILMNSRKGNQDKNLING